MINFAQRFADLKRNNMKETLEEAAVINYKKLYEGEPLTQDVPIDAFIEGAKWQAQCDLLTIN